MLNLTTATDEGGDSDVKIVAADTGRLITVTIYINGVCLAAIGVPKPLDAATASIANTAQLTSWPAEIADRRRHWA